MAVVALCINFAFVFSDKLMRLKSARILVVLLAILALWGCSTTKHVPKGCYLIDKVSIEMEGESTVGSGDLYNYLRQVPNHKVLGFLKLQLATYSLSGRDSTKWYNRWLRRIGQAPVIYDQALTDASARQLQLAMVNRGYMDATVSYDTVFNADKKKAKVAYHVTPGEPHVISSVSYNIPDSVMYRFIMADTFLSAPKRGQLLDRSALDETRSRIATNLRNRGYYAFTKEYITFMADTAENSNLIDLTLNVMPPMSRTEPGHVDSAAMHKRYFVKDVYFVTNYHPGETLQQIHANTSDSVEYRGIKFLYGTDRYIKPGTLEEKCFITPGTLYRERTIDRTYEALTQLGILRSININTIEVPSDDEDEAEVDVYILLSRNKKQSITFEVEGTNSEGDLGVGGSVTYQHRNLGHRSELLTAKVRANYESISGNLDGFINDRYTEYAAELGVTFPKFQFPFLSRNFKRKVKASTEFALSFNYQERPEYTRIIAGGAWKYKWNNRRNTERRTFDLVDINYVYLPKSTLDFISQIAPDNPLLRYSYEDHFIMRMGYTFNRTNKRIPATTVRRQIIQSVVYSMRASAEIAGNLLYGISHLIGQHRDDGVYKLFGVPYSQYAKAEFDYTITRNFNPRHSLAFHVGAGIGVPYGNSKAIPFEKRFYAGGANGVRGWGVRTLGPGAYDSKNSVTSFINQCGDISLLLSAEYRAKLFWIIEAGAFIDAGNVWTIHNYENQPGGFFRFKNFWKEVAWAYGLGLRLDFTYFLFRIDLGMKAYNPAANQERWPIVHPRWGRDATVHFSVGYPF